MTTIAPEAAAVTALPTIVPAAVGIGRVSRGIDRVAKEGTGERLRTCFCGPRWGAR